MPTGVKPINCVGKKGRSGRKSKAVEFFKFAENIKAEALVEMANKMVAHQFTKHPENWLAAKEFALPIALRGMTEKVKVSGKFSIGDILRELKK
jgi:hypothetical protein